KINITYPEEHKTVIETIHPMIDIDKAGYRSPDHFNINSPIVTAAPVFSRYLPIIVPKIITNPMLATIDPTPDVITSVKLEIMGSLNITRPIILAPNPNK